MSMFTKRFCCSNDARTVAKILGIVDIAFSILMILILSSFVHIYRNYPQTLQKMTEENPDNQEDLRKFLAWGTEKKVFMLSIPFTGSFMNGFKGALLLIGAHQHHLKSIKIWLILTFIFLVFGFIAFIAEVIFTQEKGLMVCFTILDWIYEAYSIWIGKSLFVELKIQTNAQTQSHETMETNVTLSPARSPKNEAFQEPMINTGNEI